MRVAVRYFAVARERAGREAEELDLPAGATVADALAAVTARHPALDGLASRLRVAVDREFADLGRALREGEEVALIPPVAGGAGPLARLSRAPIDPSEAAAAVAGPDAGAVVVFTGVVRGDSEGRRVESLTYEAYPEMAGAVLSRIAEEAGRRWPGARVAIVHRVGTLRVGEVAVAVAAAAPHRAEAFEACRFAIDTLKRDAPIWKKESGPDGEVWVGCGA